jgi:metal-responsive CopG/Arc/MetJ family transcriptional regulator
MWMIIHIIIGVGAMKTIQMTIDENLLQRVDQTVEDLQTTRSAFIRLALEQALRQYHVRRLEERDEIGYTAVPATTTEIEDWQTEQEWEDEWNGEK